MRKNVGAKHDLFSLTARARPRCFYDTHLETPDSAALRIYLSSPELTRSFPRHNTAQYWRAWEVAMFCLSQHREVRVTI